MVWKDEGESWKTGELKYFYRKLLTFKVLWITEVTKIGNVNIRFFIWEQINLVAFGWISCSLLKWEKNKIGRDGKIVFAISSSQ